MRRIFREPLVHFLLLGGLIFFTATYFNNKKRIAEQTIVISNEKIGNIVRLYQVQTGNFPTKTQLDAMIEDYIKEEVYYRESVKTGLDKEDEIIRRRLSQKMEFLQSDLSVVPPPAKKQLQDFYLSHLSQFRDSSTVSFTHIFFSSDKTGVANAQERARQVRKTLEENHSQRDPAMGDPFSLQYDYADINKLDVIQLFGNKPMKDSLFESPLKKWIGPVESGYGWHLLFILERKKSIIPSFESVLEKVKENYTATEKDSLNKTSFEKMKNKYIIQRDYLNY